MVDISTEAEDGYIRQLADWCRSCADVVLDHERVYFQPQHGIDSDLAFAVDWRYFSESLPGTATCPAHEPATWIALIASTYLTESALLCRSMASLLDGGTFAVGLDVLTRAVLERNGRLQWVLDDKATSRQRGARAGLEMTVCQQHYRRSIEQIAHERVDKKAAKVEHVRLREGLAALFGSVQKPLSDPCNEESKPSGEATEWIVDGEAYPTYTNVVRWPLGDQFPKLATGTYGGYAGFSHPNVQFAKEHRQYEHSGRVTYLYPPSDLEKDVRLAAWTTLDSARRWVSYIGGDVGYLQRQIETLDTELGTFSALNA